MELDQTQSLDNGDDEQNTEYYDYRSKTRLGSRYDTVIALYGAVNPWTLYCYWFKDSILKQSIMLLDKSGLRKKGASSKVKKTKDISDEDLAKLWSSSIGVKDNGAN